MRSKHVFGEVACACGHRAVRDIIEAQCVVERAGKFLCIARLCHPPRARLFRHFRRRDHVFGQDADIRCDDRPPHGLRLRHHAAECRRLDCRHHHCIRCSQGRRHVAAVSRLPNQWPYTFILRLFHHGARVFAMAAMSPASTKTKPRIPPSSMMRAISGTTSCPFQGGTRPRTSKIRAAGPIRQALRKAAILAGSTAAGSNAVRSMLRGMMVSRSREILWRAIMGAAAKFDGVITESPRASPASQYARRREAGGTSGSVVTSKTEVCAAAMLAIHAPPALCACTMSIRSEAIRRCRLWAPLLSWNGLTVAFTRGTHSPPDPVSSATSGPSSAATSARAPISRSAAATLSAVRAAGSSRNAGTICKTVAPAKVRGCSLSSLLTEFISFAPRRLVCRRGMLVFNGRTGPNTPRARCVHSLTDSADERCLPQILECWNRHCGAPNRRPPARRSSCRPVLARRIQVRHERHEGRGTGSMGAGEWPGDDALRLFGPRRIWRQFQRGHDRPMARGGARRVRRILPRPARDHRLVNGGMAGVAAKPRTRPPNPGGCARGAARPDRAGGRLY